MLLRSLFLLLFSSQVYSAGITIDVNNSPCIDGLSYFFDPSPEIASIEPGSRSGILSKKNIIIEYDSPGCLHKTLSVGEKASGNLFAYYARDYVVYKEADSNGELIKVNLIKSVDYLHELKFRSGKSIFIDNELDTIEVWNESLNYWASLNDLYSYPNDGFIEDIFLFSGHYYVSIIGGADEGLWKLGFPSIKTSDFPLSVNPVVGTSFGLFQFDFNGRLLLREIGADETEYAIDVDIKDVKYFRTMQTSSGVYFFIGGDEFSKIYYLDEDAQVLKSVKIPHDVSVLHGCNGHYPNAFCAAASYNLLEKSIFMHIYRLLDGEFVLDAVIKDQVVYNSGLSLMNVAGYGKNRVITFFEGENKIRVYTLNEEGLHLVDTIFPIRGKSSAFFLDGLSGDSFYLGAKNSDSVLFRKFLVDGSAIENIENLGVPIDDVNVPQDVDENIEEVIEEREETAGDEEEPRPRAELSGAVSIYYSFAIMFVLLVGRRKA